MGKADLLAPCSWVASAISIARENTGLPFKAPDNIPESSRLSFLMALVELLFDLQTLYRLIMRDCNVRSLKMA